MAIDFLEDIICSQPALLPSEHRASSQLLRMLTKEESDRQRERVDLHNVLNLGQVRRISIQKEWPSRISPRAEAEIILTTVMVEPNNSVEKLHESCIWPRERYSRNLFT